MKVLSCEKCAATEFIEESGYRVCSYCHTRYVMDDDERAVSEVNIEIDSDIQMLLMKCREDPVNARKYANLILDIDPGNLEAKRFL